MALSECSETALISRSVPLSHGALLAILVETIDSAEFIGISFLDSLTCFTEVVDRSNHSAVAQWRPLVNIGEDVGGGGRSAVPLAGIVARVSLEIGVGNRRLKAPAARRPRPPTFGHSRAKPRPPARPGFDAYLYACHPRPVNGYLCW